MSQEKLSDIIKRSPNGVVVCSSGIYMVIDYPWSTGSGITSISIATANGFAGSSSGGATPTLTYTTTVTGMIKGNGTAMSAAVPDVDYATMPGVLKRISFRG